MPLRRGTPPPARTQASSRTIERVTFELDASLLFLTLTNSASLTAMSSSRPDEPGRARALRLTASGGDDGPHGFRYSYQNRPRSLDDFVTETRVAGLLVLKDGNIVAERHSEGRGASGCRSQWQNPYSLLYGAAVQDGSLSMTTR